MCRTFRYAIILLIAFTPFGPPTVAQQPEVPVVQEPAKEDELAAPMHTVQLEAESDAAIAQRLDDILTATGRFSDVDVRVENGVVFLSGEATRESFKESARELALRTEDVVFVVNNIAVVEPIESIWDFAPAWAEIRTIGRQTVRSLPLLVLGLAIVLATIAGGRVVARLTRHSLRGRVESQIVREVVVKTVVVFVIILGIYFFLRLAGLTRLAVTMLGGTGLFGLIVGFAFRDIAENYLASLLISVQKPFRIGDTIEVEGNIGVVQKVTTRGTVLMAFDGNFIQLANSTVYKSTIRNMTANPKTRLDFVVGIGYDNSITQAQEVVLQVLHDHPAVLADPEPQVLVERLGASTIDLRVYYWFNIHEFSLLKVRSAVMRLTVRALVEAGISLPDEAREIVFPKSVPVRMLEPEEEARKEEAVEHRVAERRRHESTAQATESEGDLTSEVGELQAQANAARTPEEGRDLLEEK